MWKGALKMVILYFLKKRPMNGYELIKEIEEYFESDYAPSPGVIYPALRSLEERGFVEKSLIGSKKVYVLTDKGREYVQKEEDRIEELISHIKKLSCSKNKPVKDAIKRLFRTLYVYLPEVDEKNALEVAKIIDEARIKILNLFEGGGKNG